MLQNLNRIGEAYLHIQVVWWLLGALFVSCLRNLEEELEALEPAIKVPGDDVVVF